jgi:hypothetical protein
MQNDGRTTAYWSSAEQRPLHLVSPVFRIAKFLLAGRERTQFVDSSAPKSLNAPDRSSSKRKQKKRKSREDRATSGSPSEAQRSRNSENFLT